MKLLALALFWVGFVHGQPLPVSEAPYGPIHLPTETVTSLCMCLDCPFPYTGMFYLLTDNVKVSAKLMFWNASSSAGTAPRDMSSPKWPNPKFLISIPTQNKLLIFHSNATAVASFEDPVAKFSVFGTLDVIASSAVYVASLDIVLFHAAPNTTLHALVSNPDEPPPDRLKVYSQALNIFAVAANICALAVVDDQVLYAFRCDSMVYDTYLVAADKRLTQFSTTPYVTNIIVSDSAACGAGGGIRACVPDEARKVMYVACTKDNAIVALSLVDTTSTRRFSTKMKSPASVMLRANSNVVTVGGVGGMLNITLSTLPFPSVGKLTHWCGGRVDAQSGLDAPLKCSMASILLAYPGKVGSGPMAAASSGTQTVYIGIGVPTEALPATPIPPGTLAPNKPLSTPTPNKKNVTDPPPTPPPPPPTPVPTTGFTSIYSVELPGMIVRRYYPHDKPVAGTKSTSQIQSFGSMIAPSGIIYFTDPLANVIAYIFLGNYRKWVGTGTGGLPVDNVLGQDAVVKKPWGIVQAFRLISGRSIFFFTDTGNAVIRRISADAKSPVVSPMMTTPFVAGSPNGIAAYRARLYFTTTKPPVLRTQPPAPNATMAPAGPKWVGLMWMNAVSGMYGDVVGLNTTTKPGGYFEIILDCARKRLLFTDDGFSVYEWSFKRNAVSTRVVGTGASGGAGVIFPVSEVDPRSYQLTQRAGSETRPLVILQDTLLIGEYAAQRFVQLPLIPAPGASLHCDWTKTESVSFSESRDDSDTASNRSRSLELSSTASHSKSRAFTNDTTGSPPQTTKISRLLPSGDFSPSNTKTTSVSRTDEFGGTPRDYETTVPPEPPEGPEKYKENIAVPIQMVMTALSMCTFSPTSPVLYQGVRIIETSRCRVNPIDRLSHVTGFEIGLGWLAPYRGAVVMNWVLALSSLAAFFALDRMNSMHRKVPETFPGHGLWPTLMLHMPTSWVASRLIFHSKGNLQNLFLGLFGLFLCGVLTVATGNTLRKNSRGSLRLDALFELYQEDSFFFPAWELFWQVLFCVLASFQPISVDGCTAQLVGEIVWQLVHLATIVRIRPYKTSAHEYQRGVMDALNILAGICIVFSIWANQRGIGIVGEWIFALSAFVVTMHHLKFFLQHSMLFVRTYGNELGYLFFRKKNAPTVADVFTLEEQWIQKVERESLAREMKAVAPREFSPVSPKRVAVPSHYSPAGENANSKWVRAAEPAPLPPPPPSEKMWKTTPSPWVAMADVKPIQTVVAPAWMGVTPTTQESRSTATTVDVFASPPPAGTAAPKLRDAISQFKTGGGKGKSHLDTFVL